MYLNVTSSFYSLYCLCLSKVKFHQLFHLLLISALYTILAYSCVKFCYDIVITVSIPELLLGEFFLFETVSSQASPLSLY